MISPSIIALAGLSRHIPPRKTSKRQHKAISNQSERGQEPSCFQGISFIDRHIRIDLQHCVKYDESVLSILLAATDNVDVGICCLGRGNLLWDSATATLPSQLLLDESLQLEV